MFHETIYKRIRIVFLITILIFIIILVRVFYIEVFSYNKLSKLSNDLWSRNLPIGANRGRILDRNGEVIADNATTTSLVLVPSQIKNKEDAAKKISDILGVSYTDMYKHVTKKTSIERVHPEGRNLDYVVSDKINSLNIDGVYLLKESKRIYPYNNLLSHTLGYVGIDNQGLSGIELYYDKYLTGMDGSIKYISDGKGKKLSLDEEYNMPTSGMDITLTIDLKLQQFIENELDNIVSKYNPDDAIVIAMDPNTGEILALANRPDFNPNNYKDYSNEVINRNLGIWKTYEPGSTFKILTLSAALEEKKVNLFEDTFYDTGKIKVEGATIKCHKREGHGYETFLNVVENSCNLLVNTGTHLSL